MRLSLVIPCYNEARNLPLLVARLRETFVRDDVEVVLVDNGSTDGSAAVLADNDRPRSERTEALKFVVHFVGDVHQPLHSGPRPA